MPSPVSTTPTDFVLGAVKVGKAVSSAHLVRIASECSFLGLHNLQLIGQYRVQPTQLGTTTLGAISHTIPFVYKRSAGCEVVAIVIEFWQSSYPGRFKITLSSSGSPSFIEHNGIDGSVTFTQPPLTSAQSTEIVAYIDVSSFTVGSTYYFYLTVSDKSTLHPTEGVIGIKNASLFEVPCPDSRVVSQPSEPILEQASCLSPNRLIDGSNATARGLTRLAWLLDQYRTNWRIHIAHVGFESSDTSSPSLHWYHTGGSYSSPNWQFEGGATRNVGFICQPRALYPIPGNTNPYKIYVRYRTTSSGNVTLRVYHTPRGGSTTTSTFTLGGTSGAWSWYTNDLDLDTGGTDDVCEYYFEAKGGAQTVDFANISFIEQHP
jgi:hypothetical protein